MGAAYAFGRSVNTCPALVSPPVALALDVFAPSLAENLRGAVAQVLVRRIGGGRLAAREVLLNTPAVAGAIAEGPGGVSRQESSASHSPWMNSAICGVASGNASAIPSRSSGTSRPRRRTLISIARSE